MEYSTAVKTNEIVTCINTDGISKTTVRKNSQKNNILHNATYINSSETGKYKEHIRDIDTDGRCINKNMELLTKKIQNVCLLCCV